MRKIFYKLHLKYIRWQIKCLNDDINFYIEECGKISHLANDVTQLVRHTSEKIESIRGDLKHMTKIAKAYEDKLNISRLKQ